MKAKWLQLAQDANFKAYNCLCGLSDPYDKYSDQLALQSARLFSVAAYCLKRYAISKF